MSAAFDLREIACRRGGRLLFEGLSLALDAGAAAIVIGPNGCGKSSLLRLIAGLLPPVAGEIAWTGSTALMGDASALDSDLRLADALRFWAGLDDAQDPVGRVTAALEAVGLSAIADVPVRLLSTGQRRRGGLARVIASGANLWLLDEPATGLDAASIVLLERTIARHRAAGGIVLVATHQPLAIPAAATLDLAALAAVAA